MARNGIVLGWIPDHPDHRDHAYAAPAAVLRALPPKMDLRASCPPVYDQGRIGSCTANAIAGAIQFDRVNAREKPDFVPSRLFIYYNERSAEHTVRYDAGAMIRDGIKSVAKLGVCPETDWPYDDTPAEDERGPFPAGAREASKPPAKCYEEALAFKVVSYQRLDQTLPQLKGCLASGYPFVCGISCYSSLWGADGRPATVVPMPGRDDRLEGGHAIVGVGYDDTRALFTMRNSWGPAVQDHGYFYLPYEYLTNAGLADDFWTIRTVAH